MRALLLLIPALLAAVETAPLPVHRVVDGDTIEVVADLGGVPMVVPVRILWIDAPESRGPNAMPEGREAAIGLQSIIAGSEFLFVIISAEGESFQRDRYGRLLANVALTARPGTSDRPDTRSRDLARLLVEFGGAVYWQRYGPAPAERHEALVTAQQNARSAGRRIWGTAREWAEARAAERPEE